ncbi:MAG: hypothetical protein AB7Q17_12265 [Phycisphaerae bacterium]
MPRHPQTERPGADAGGVAVARDRRATAAAGSPLGAALDPGGAGPVPEGSLAALLVLTLAVLVGFMPIPRDPDLWFHLAGGDFIRTTRDVPSIDVFSITRGGAPWVPHSWLFDMLVSTAWATIGPRATEALMALVFAAAVLGAYQMLRRSDVSPVLACLVCAALAIAAGNSRGLRPQVFSLLFTVLTLGALLAHAIRPGRRILLTIPVLFVVWAQLHGACVMGVGVMLIWFVGRVVDALVERAWGERRFELRMLAACVGLGAVAVLVTPHEITHYEYLALTMKLKYLHANVAEWQAPKALSASVPDVHAYVLLGGLLLVLGRSRRAVPFAPALTSAALLMLALSGARHIPLAWVGAIPLLGSVLGAAARRAAPAERGVGAEAMGPRAAPTRVAGGGAARRAAAAGMGAVGVFAGLWSYPTTVRERYSRVEPVRGAALLAAKGRDVRVFTTYNTGAYVLWCGAQHLRVFVDSRADVYGDDVLWRAHRAAGGIGWEAVFAEYGIEAAVLERRERLCRILRSDRSWRVLAEDAATVTFIRRDAFGEGPQAIAAWSRLARER